MNFLFCILTLNNLRVTINIELGQQIAKLGKIHKLATTKLHEILYESYLAPAFNQRKCLTKLDIIG